jgi:hypothetical protein
MTAPQADSLRAQKVTTVEGEDQLVLAYPGDEPLPDIPELLPTTIVEVIDGPTIDQYFPER